MALGSFAFTSAAHAAAGQWQAGGRLGMAWLDGSSVGMSVEGHMRRGIGESLDLDLEVLSSVHPFHSDEKTSAAGTTTSATAWAIGVTPGVLYRWDVLRVVPYVGLGIGLYDFIHADEPLDGLQFGAAGRFGLDYLLTRSVVLSVQMSAHLALTDDGARLPWIQGGVGASHAWGW